MPNTTVWAQANPTGVTGYSTTAEGNGTYGMYFTVAKAGTVQAIWFYSPVGGGFPNNPTAIALYNSSGTQLAVNNSPSWSVAGGNGWTRATIAATAVSAGTTYVAAYYFGTNPTTQGFIFTGSSPAAWFPSTSADGNITAPQSNAGAANGPFNNGTGLTFPTTNNANNLNWLADVEIQFAATTGTEAPTPPAIPHHLWHKLLEVAQTRADWQAQGVASPATPATATTWRMMDGGPGRPGPSGPGTATANSSGITLGNAFYVTQGGLWFQGYWWWVCPAGGQPTTPQKFCLWSINQTSGSSQVIPGTQVTSGTLSAGWNYIPLPNPVPLSLWGIYTAATGTSGPYPMTSAQFAGGDPYPGGIVNGPAQMFSDTTGNGGTNPVPFGGLGQMPTAANADPTAAAPVFTSAAAPNYWLDFQITNSPPAGYQGSYRLWPNMVDGDWVTTADSAVNYIIGTEIIISQPVAVNAIWYMVPTGMGSSGNQWATSADIWNVRTGKKVATQPNPVWRQLWNNQIDGNSNADRWVYTQMNGVTILPPGDYYVTIYNGNGSPNGWGAKRLGWWQSNTAGGVGPPQTPTVYGTGAPGQNGVTNGPLYAPTTPQASSIADFINPAIQEPGQSVFATGPPNQFPNQYVGTPQNLFQNYWVDIEVTPVSVLPNAPDLPPRIPHPLWTRLLAAAAERKNPGIDAPSVSSGVTGTTAALTFTAPAGSIRVDSGVTGVTAAAILAAPAGSVSADGTIAGAVAAVTLSASAGTAAAGSSVTGTAAGLSLDAPAGSVAAGDVVNGVTAALTLAAPAGAVRADSAVTGTPAALTFAAPAGAPAEGSIAAGVPAVLALAAPAGSLTVNSTVTGVTATMTLAALAGFAHSGTQLAKATSSPAVAPQATVTGAVVHQATSAPTVG